MLKRLKTLLSICILVTVSAQAFADTVSMRTGKHADYSRLVFDWAQNVDYTVTRENDGTVLVTFKKDASLDTQSSLSKPLANISAFELLSTAPLTVKVSVSAESRIRDLRAGTKVVIDVFNPSAGPKDFGTISVSGLDNDGPAEVAAKEEKPDEAAQQPPSTELKAPEAVPVLDKAAEMVEKQIAELSEQNADATVTADTDQAAENIVKIKARAPNTMVTISSTDNFGIAAFRYAGRLWVVNDKSNLLIRPQINGPLKETMSPIQEIENTRGVAYLMHNPPGSAFKGQGGGILWRVLVGPSVENKEKPSTPLRKDVERNEIRSGKIVWPLDGARSILDFTDPVTGQEIKVVTVGDAESFAGKPREFVDFSVPESAVGLAIIPKVADLNVQLVRGGIEITRKDGLSIIDDKLLESITKVREPANQNKRVASSAARIFDFKAWRLGGVLATDENKRVILGDLKSQADSAQAESLLTLGQMYVANAMGPEALGALDYAVAKRNDLWQNPEFSAIYGVAAALSYHNRDAYGHLSRELLQPFEEVQLWRAFVLADEGDWQQAAEIMPANIDMVYDYPELLQNRLIPRIAEIALRDGKLDTAKELLQIAFENRKEMNAPERAALAYLLGETARQNGDIEKTLKFWEPLTIGRDDLYRAKAGLALTRLKIDEGLIKPEESIDKLERLRYAWRGDELEVQINYWLGRTYFEAGEHLRGLKVMRDAVTFDRGTPLGSRVAGDMADLFSGLFLSPQINNVSALDAVALYDEFKELVPLDERGDVIIQQLAEILANADLLERAGDLLDHQLEHRLQGSDVYRVAIRLAAIRLLDNKPDMAIAALDKAAAKLETLPEEFKTPARYRDILMLRARAISRNGRPDQALALLNGLDRTPEMDILRSDIAWTAGYWDDAAEALGDVIANENISLTRPLSDKHAALLLQRAVALNLAGDRIALANLREKYDDLMKQTQKAKVFEVITRARQNAALADRETILSVVSEVDLFEDFLESYRSITPPVN